MKIAIINYGMGNLASVANACKKIGADFVITTNPKDLETVEKIILPGVGSFPDGMRNLTTSGWIPPLEKAVLQQCKPFLGICLGMQLLATTGYEHEICKGLDWIQGEVRLMKNNSGKLRVPHIGWNTVYTNQSKVLFNNILAEKDFYFVHSYILKPNDENLISATCNYGGEFAAGIEKDNIFATQFHPEKSQQDGLTVLTNFVNFRGKTC